MMRKATTTAVAVLAIALGACSSQGTESSQGAENTSTSQPAATTPTVEATSTTAEVSVGFELGVEMEPGSYSSETFATPVTFTVSAGWKVFEDDRGQFGLARMANDGPPLLVLRDIAPASVDCREEPEPGVGNSSEVFSSWLAVHDGLVTTEPIEVTVGGLQGRVLDVSLDPSWTESCPFSEGTPTVMTLVGTDISRGLHWGVDPSDEQRIWILDLPTEVDGNIVLLGDVCCGVDREDQLAAVQAVVETFQFVQN